VLTQLKSTLDNPEFDLDKDLFLNQKHKNNGKEKYSTPYTLNELEYDASDVANTLKGLRLEEYSESLVDNDDSNPPMLYVFGKYIDCRLVYIKFKIKDNNKIACVSFHFPEEKMTFPYG
jgi:hypothetical protein